MVFTEIMISVADRDKFMEGLDCHTRDFELGSVGNVML